MLIVGGTPVPPLASRGELTCCPCGDPSLEDEIGEGWQRPIAVDAIRRPRDIQDGVEVRGDNLKDSTVSVTWSGGTKEMVVAAVGWLDEGPIGEGQPVGMAPAWVPFDCRGLGAGRGQGAVLARDYGVAACADRRAGECDAGGLTDAGAGCGPCGAGVDSAA